MHTVTTGSTTGSSPMIARVRAGPGTAVPRNEDQALLTGAARFLPDLRFGQAYAAFVRSALASARLGAIRTERALAAPGVLAVATAADLGLRPIRAHLSGVLSPALDRPPLARDSVRFVGEAIAVVVAEAPGPAADAALLVEVDYEVLPVVVDPEDALAPDAFVLFTEHGSNRAHEVRLASASDPLDGADAVVRGRFVNQRLSAAPLETNGALAVPGPAQGTVTVEVNPHGTSQYCSRCGARGERFSLQAGRRVTWRGGKLFWCSVWNSQVQADFNASVNLHHSFYREFHWQPRPKRSG